MKLKIKKINPNVILPTRGSKGAAGWDIYAPPGFNTHHILTGIGSSDEAILCPGWTISIKCGFSLEIPEGYYISIVPRSSMGKRGLYIPNSPATIDSDYTGEFMVVLQNLGHDMDTIVAGDRIAQIILHKYHEMEFEEVDDIKSTERGSGGFGSTGK